MRLSTLGYEVIAVDNLSPGLNLILKQWRLSMLDQNRRVVFRPVDITSPTGLFKLLVQFKPAIIIHLGGEPAVDQGFGDPFTCLKTNLDGTLHVLEAARRTGVKKVIQASSTSIYQGLPAPFPEDAILPLPRSPLTVSQIGAEGLCQAYHARHGLGICILRFSHVYGPAGPLDDSLAALIWHALAGRPAGFVGSGSDNQDYVYISDVVQGTIDALDLHGCQIINLGGGSCTTRDRLAAIIEGYAGCNTKRLHESCASTDSPLGWADITKARRLLNWSPRVSMEQGLLETVAWMQDHWSLIKKLMVSSGISPISSSV